MDQAFDSRLRCVQRDNARVLAMIFNRERVRQMTALSAWILIKSTCILRSKITIEGNFPLSKIWASILTVKRYCSFGWGWVGKRVNCI
jgi:hypothetical protein